MDNTFNVNDMIKVADEQTSTNDSLFIKKKKTTPAPVVMKRPIDELREQENEDNGYPKPKHEVWRPDAEDLAQVSEMTKPMGAVYNKEDVKLKEDTKLKDLGDEVVKEGSNKEKADMDIIIKNIREACARNNIRALHIPEVCPERLQIINVASHSNETTASELDTIIVDIHNNHPDWIIENDPVPETNPSEVIQKGDKPEDPKLIQLPINSDTVQITIDKSQADDLSWTDDEAQKLKMARTIELNIRERKPINFSNIKRAPSHSAKAALSKYKSKLNSLDIALPASRYRCTLTPISYPEMITLNSSRHINTMDSKLAIWTVCFNHIINPSIGEWEEYVEYYDTELNYHRIGIDQEVPEDAINVVRITKFDDFLRKTSYLDLQYILWNLYCITATNMEVITVRCKGTDKKPCSNSFECTLNPADLLDKEKIPENILEEMEKTRTVFGHQIQEWYNDCLMKSQALVELPDSKFQVIYGHTTAYEYIYELDGIIRETEEIIERLSQSVMQMAPSDMQRLNINLALPSVLGFVISDEDNPGEYLRYDSVEDRITFLESLSPSDWSVIQQLGNMITEPYSFDYSIRKVRCPKCGKIQNIILKGIDDLLFMIAELGNSTHVLLKN